MISSVSITLGYATKLPAVAGKTFKFTPGLNILFGPNGCGKTTVLRTAAAFVGCYGSGWSKPVRATFDDKKIPYPNRFSVEAPGKCVADVSWDGVPGFLHSVDIRQTGMFSDDPDEFDDQLAAIMTKPSAGQLVIAMVNKLKILLTKVPDITDLDRTITMNRETVSYKYVNETWQEYILSFVNYVKSVQKKAQQAGPPTLFIDEPDKALSIPNQHVLWSKSLPGLAERFQVVTASHSPFALATPGANVIEMEDGYIAECRKVIQSLVSFDEIAIRAKKLGAEQAFVTADGYTLLPEQMQRELATVGNGAHVWFIKRDGVWEAWPEQKLADYLV